MRVRTLGLFVFLSALGVFALSLNGLWAADHPSSLLELANALWSSHSVSLGKAGQFHPQSVDDFEYKGSYYSALAPGAAVLASPFVALGNALDGGFMLFGYTMLLSELFVALCDAVAAYLVYKLASMYFSGRTSAFVAFAYAFSTIGWPFATYFFESDVSAMFDLLAVLTAVRASRGGSLRGAEGAACGAALGAALTVDYVNALLVPIVFAFLSYSFRRELARAAGGLAGLLAASGAGAALVGLYDLAAFGNPLLTSEQAYQHTSSLFGSFSYPILEGLYLDLFSPLRGIFVYCPVLVLGAVGFYFVPRRTQAEREALLLAACFAAILIPYSMWYDAAGGEGFGQRFLVPAIPFLLLPSGFLLEAERKAVSALAYALYAAGVIFNGAAALTTAIPQVEAVSHFPFLTQVVPRMLSGPMDVWWARQVGPDWWAPTAVVLAIALALPMVAVELLSREVLAGGGEPPGETVLSNGRLRPLGHAALHGEDDEVHRVRQGGVDPRDLPDGDRGGQDMPRLRDEDGEVRRLRG